MSTPTLDTTAPPNPSGLPATAPPTIEEPVTAYQLVLAAAVAGAIAAVVPGLPGMPMANPFTWWYSGGSNSPANRAFIALATAQEVAAAGAREYVVDVMAAQGHLVALPDLQPLALAGAASDGRDIDKLLEQPIWAAWGARRSGASPAEARAAAALTMDRILHTQIMDAGREAVATHLAAGRLIGLEPEDIDAYEDDFERGVQQVIDRINRQLDEEDAALLVQRDALRVLQDAQARELIREAERITRRAAREDIERAPRVQLGWIRVLTPPSCGRCVALAGRWYRWSEDFLRHENCDCIQVPAASAGAAEPLLTDPDLYFESLTPAEQQATFGKAGAEAIRNGADVARVVNAYRKGSLSTVDGYTYTSEGTTKRGYYPKTEGGRAGAPRATPTTIIRAAGGDQAEVRRLLARFGYIR